ncbi:MAG: hypothetical protein MK052_06325 [Alphaproteobacteria bacterium]|nr:hypothetical protein [Alphaproteobacteria bacterium]
MPQKHLCLLALIAFVMNAVVPFFAIYSLSDTAYAQTESIKSALPAALFGDQVLICTESGFEWVKREDLQKKQGHPQPESQFKCALCYVAAHSTQCVGDAGAYALLFATNKPLHIKNLVSVTELTSTLLQRTHLSRAPPYSVVV